MGWLRNTVSAAAVRRVLHPKLIGTDWDRPAVWHPGYVYLMANPYCYKIGVSTHPERRRRSIELASGLPTRIIATVGTGNMYGMERELHKLFDRYRGEGEWFRLPGQTGVEAVLEAFEMIRRKEMESDGEDN